MGRYNIVLRYIECSEKLYPEHRILERAKKLAHKVLTASDKSIMIFLIDNLDQERIQYMREAENYDGYPPPQWVYEWLPLLERTG